MKQPIQKLRAFMQTIVAVLFFAGLYMVFKKYVFLATLPIMLVLGPIFCGWLCPYGAIQRVTAWLGKKTLGKHFNKLISKDAHKILKYMRYLVALLFIAVPLIVDFPLTTLITWFLYGGILLSLTTERFYCKYLCKDGAIYSLLNLFKLKKIKRDSGKCVSCGKCDKVCPMNINISEKKVVRDIACISCYKCTGSCPIEGSLHTQHKTKNKGLIIAAWLIPILIVSSLAFAGQVFIKSNQETVSIESDAISNAESVDPNAEQTTWMDGIYEATVRAYKSGMTVQVTVTGGQITDVQIPSHNESRGYYEYPFKVIPEQIIETQSTNVNIVSGATYTSRGIMNGVDTALEKAITTSKSQVIEKDIPAVEEVANIDPIVEETVVNNEPVVEEAVVINEPVVEEVVVSSEPVVEEVVVISEPVVEEVVVINDPVIEEVVVINEPVVEEAVVINEPVVEEVVVINEAIVEETVMTKWIDGIYTATVRAYRPNMQVQTTIKDDQIIDIQIVSHRESRGYYERAFEQIPASIISTQPTNVDTVSGATYTSKGIINGVKEALSQALR